MLVRLVPQSGGRFPRWGFLDRYAENEHLAPACAVVGAGTLLLLAAMHLVHLPPVPLSMTTEPRPGGGCVIDLAPPPIVHVPRRPAPVGTPAPPTSPPAGRLVPSADAARVDWEPTPAARAPIEGEAGASGSTEQFDVESGGIEAPGLESPGLAAHLAVEQEPQLLTLPEPVYPDLAREARIEGTVMVRALVGDDGHVVEALVVESVLGLDEAALDAVRGAAFEPAEQQGRAVAAWVLVTIEFRLFR